MGLTNTVAAVSAIPVVACATFLIKRCGHTKLLALCMLIYGSRFFSYAVIWNYYMVLPVEILEAFTTSLLWMVASVYCGKIAPDYLATLQGIIGAVHQAFGKKESCPDQNSGK